MVPDGCRWFPTEERERLPSRGRNMHRSTNHWLHQPAEHAPNNQESAVTARGTRRLRSSPTPRPHPLSGEEDQGRIRPDPSRPPLDGDSGGEPLPLHLLPPVDAAEREWRDGHHNQVKKGSVRAGMEATGSRETRRILSREKMAADNRGAARENAELQCPYIA